MMGDVRLSKHMCPISMLNVISSYKCPTGNFSVRPGILLSIPCYEIPNPWRSRLALLQILVTNTDKRLFIDVVTFVITKNLDCIYLVIVITWSFQATAMRAGMEYQFQSQHNGMGSLSRWCACQLVFQIHMHESKHSGERIHSSDVSSTRNCLRTFNLGHHIQCATGCHNVCIYQSSARNFESPVEIRHDSILIQKQHLHRPVCPGLFPSFVSFILILLLQAVCLA